MPYRKDKLRAGLCESCRTRPRAKQQGGFLSLCWHCRTEIKKERQPIRYAYSNLKKSAKVRGIPFKLSYEEWEKWCGQTGYIDKKGKQKGDMSVGRIDHSKGYTLSNIQLEEYHFNSIRGHEIPGQNVPQNHQSVYEDEDPF